MEDAKGLRPPSLLEVIDAREEKEGARECLSHVLYIATTADTASASDFHSEIISELHNRGKDQRVTGRLLVQDGVLLHYYETGPTSSIALLRHLHNFSNEGKITSLRVLMSSEDVDRRHFGDWSCETVEPADEEKVPVPESSSDETIELAFDVLSQMLKIATGANASHQCPSKARLQSYAKSDAFFTLAKYLETFDGPISFALESEASWPLQPVVDYRDVQ
uniref:BLUF domain-containing protein n=1 Tax=Rhizochromulina marina TaxID=1034831 RepID=A0A7S2WV92_9STRA|mmetsp:Transcript_8116/g.23052  ORF Transcript_8116/g.23052 Transcript_8116/m.23052 type:complete len:221 (+) Transcript_8116:174-836(+)